MSLPTSRAAYEQYYEIWDRALADPAGIRLRVPDYDTAIFHRTRLHFSRTIQKNESRDLYEPGDPNYNISPYDRYQCLIRPTPDREAFHLLIVPRTFGIIGEIESLAGTEYEPKWQHPSEVQSYRPQLISPTGVRLLLTKLDSTSDAPIAPDSSSPSTTPGESISEAPETNPLRRL